MFNGGKIRKLEQALAEAQAKVDRYEAAILSAACALSPKESNALELLANATDGLLPLESLPTVTFTI